ncbi:type II secretion system minor pseudopilin GspI [Glaciecola sp. 1036]|uniref:type II secretion system minor pseudopilin GspI n=1 Tax=Alteromonadaceae TaxID=72275 RepID=UPI003D08A8E3
MRRTFTEQSGFTLLEVLMAVAIFALAGGAIVKAAGEHLRSVNALRNITVATWVANNQLTNTSILNRRQWPAKNNLRGESEMANRKWYWLQTVSKTQDDELNQVTVTVFEDEQRKQPITSVSSFIARETQ